MVKKLRIGVFAGTFDPVHKGHIDFACIAQKTAALDKVVFIIEPRPRQKESVTSPAHREAMLELHLEKYPSFSIHSLNQPTFDVVNTLPQLQKDFSGSELYLLVGEDVANRLLTWPSAAELLKQLKIVVGLRTQNSIHPPFADTVVATDYREVSSSTIRKALKNGLIPEATDQDVARYALRKRLYDSSVTSK